MRRMPRAPEPENEKRERMLLSLPSPMKATALFHANEVHTSRGVLSTLWITKLQLLLLDAPKYEPIETQQNADDIGLVLLLTAFPAAERCFRKNTAFQPTSESATMRNLPAMPAGVSEGRALARKNWRA
jgi:hypothetical protein